MHPALSLAKRKFDDLQTEFAKVIAIENEVVPVLGAMAAASAETAKTALRATGIEGVYTGIEGVLKEVLSVVDGGVFAAAESWHGQLLAQAAAANDANGRPSIIAERTYRLLDELRAFRHIERNVYRHLLRDREVDENFKKLCEVFPLFEVDVNSFMQDYGQHDPGQPKPT